MCFYGSSSINFQKKLIVEKSGSSLCIQIYGTDSLLMLCVTLPSQPSLMQKHCGPTRVEVCVSLEHVVMQ